MAYKIYPSNYDVMGEPSAELGSEGAAVVSPTPQPSQQIPASPQTDSESPYIKALRGYAESIYPLSEEPKMEYGQDVNINIPFTKRSLFKMSGKKMDKLAGALAAAAQGAYVPGSDPGGQFLKGFLQGYGGVRAKDYAERKATYEKSLQEKKDILKNRGRFVSDVYGEMVKAGLKPPPQGTEKYPLTADEARALGTSYTEGQMVPLGLKTEAIHLLNPTDKSAALAATYGSMAGTRFDSWKNDETVKSFLQSDKVYNFVKSYRNNPNILTDKNLLYALAKTADDRTGVREGEVTFWSDASGLVQNIKNKIAQAQGKYVMDVGTRKKALDLIEKIHSLNERQYLKNLRANRLLVSGIGISVSPDVVIPDLRANESSSLDEISSGADSIDLSAPPRRPVDDAAARLGIPAPAQSGGGIVGAIRHLFGR